MSKHTPGPWRLNDDIHCGVLGGNYHAIDAGCGFFKEDNRHQGFGLMGFMSPEDARLIAAAPELLEALKAAERSVGSRMSNALIRQVLSAIAKAEGA